MRAYNTEFVIDGSPAMQNGTTAYQPPVDMVQQGRTIVSVYDAAYGHSAGGYHVESTRSGQNKIHGTLYEYYTGDVLQSLNYFQRSILKTDPAINICPSDPSTPVRCIKGKSVYNRYGGSLGGPIVIPKIYDGRDKAFWFVAYERNPSTGTSPNTGIFFTVPTVAERAGDFSALLDYGCIGFLGVSTTPGKCNATTPQTTTVNGVTTTTQVQVVNVEQFTDPNIPNPNSPGHFYPGNKIPAGSPELQTPGALVAQKYLQYYPQPNAPCANPTPNLQYSSEICQNNYVRTVTGHGVLESFSSRMDYVFSPRDRVFGRFNHADGATYGSGPFNNAATAYIATNHANAMAVDNVFIFSPSLLMDARYSFTRERSPFVSSPPPDLASLDLPQNLINAVPPQYLSFPGIAIDSGFYQSLGSVQTNPSLVTDYHAANVDFTKQKDRHTVRFGGQFRVYENNNTDVTASTYPVPNLKFQGTLTTQGGSVTGIVAEGAGVLALVLGYPSAGSMYKLSNYAITSKYMSGYIQDDFRATARLTLNAGLLYEYETAPADRYNRLVRGFDTTDPNPISGIALANYASQYSANESTSNRDSGHLLPAPGQFQVNGGLLFAGVNGAPRTLWSTDKNNFAPRLGASLQINNTTVLHAGYGIYYMPKGADRMSGQNPADTAEPVQTGFTAGTSFQVVAPTLGPTLDNPFQGGLLPQTGSSLGLGTGLGQTISFLPTHIVNPLIQRMSFSVQRQLPKGILLELGYANTLAHHLYTTRQLNAIPDRYLSTSPLRDPVTIANLGQLLPNPFMPAIGSGTSLSNPTLPVYQFLLAYPQFFGVSYPEDNGRSNYNAGYIRGERRFSSGWSLLGNYTWSKWIQTTEYLNGGDPAPDHIISDLDIPQKFSLTGLYDIPIGRGRRFGNGWNKYLTGVVGGWQVGMIWYGQSGTPIGFGDSIYLGNYHNITLPNSKKSVNEWFNNTSTCNNAGTVGPCNTIGSGGTLINGFETRQLNERIYDLRTFPLRLPEVRTQGQNDANLSFMKYFPLTHGAKLQIRAEGYNAFNHSQFAAPNTSTISPLFGTIQSVQSIARSIYFVGKIIF
jgi:hypothetical protein